MPLLEFSLHRVKSFPGKRDQTWSWWQRRSGGAESLAKLIFMEMASYVACETDDPTIPEFCFLHTGSRIVAGQGKHVTAGLPKG